jgi:hypothetical protein
MPEPLGSGIFYFRRVSGQLAGASVLSRSFRMETAISWKSLFENWPDAIPTQGMVVTQSGEGIPFVSFMISGGLLLLERDKPDQYGTRKVILPWTQITAVRLPTTEDMARFQTMGFQRPL